MAVAILIAEMLGKTVSPAFIALAGALVVGKAALKEIREKK